MAVKAKAEITLSRIIDISSTTRYYLLQVSTANAPAKPTTNPPGGSWTTTEPNYTAGSTNTLYFVDLTMFTNDAFSYSAVSKSSSYEAAKTAYNEALNAAKTATNYVKAATEGLIVGNVTANVLGNNVLIKTTGVDIRNGDNVLASFEDDLIDLGKNNNQATIRLCNGLGLITNDNVSSADDLNRMRIFSRDSLGLETTGEYTLDIFRESNDLLSSGSIIVRGTVAQPWGNDSIIPAAYTITTEYRRNTYVAGSTLGLNSQTGIVLEHGGDLGGSSKYASIRVYANALGEGGMGGPDYNSWVQLNASDTTVEGRLHVADVANFNNHIRMPNKYAIQSYYTDGNVVTLLHLNASNNIVLGYGGYDAAIGTTYIYGNEVRITSRDNMMYANGYPVVKATKGDTSYYGLLTPENSADGWLRTTSSGLIPSAHGVSSIGSSSWRFKNGYFNNLYRGTYKLGWTGIASTKGSSQITLNGQVSINKAAEIGMVRLSVTIKPSADITSGASIDIASISETYAPEYMVALAVYAGSTNSRRWMGSIGSNGKIIVRANAALTAGTEYTIYISGMYIRKMAVPDI